ncbi:MAG: Twin-arginine translocation pathway signal [Tardiphaga sp.]|uniref:xanthine dehydrogenase family protein molybdopterin-binding subunit n=1 Tax=Tardiphaga sp. TaxID=1926292 RepID=UPI0026306CA0|nr:xanthine dehydrogenase family protein molybdopterin-binding subunit [Tardiphaga sp.]MDB5500430.1 Twin-arginine translocation pathway signal [Tardiphaga sp.]
MTVHDKATTALSRRSLLKGGAGLVLGAYVVRADRLLAQAPAAPKINIAPNTFLIIKPDNTVTVLSKGIEFGQGPFTGMATLVAEELDADWSQMRADHAPSNPELYKNLAFGIQGTGGSTAIANSYIQMRQVGAAARQMLVAAAAETWQVPAGEITVENGVIKHASGKEGRFGEFAEKAMAMPAPADPKLKDPSSFKLIGKEGVVKRLDSADKTNGKAFYTLDINEPDMLTVLVARSPKFGGKVASFDATAAKAVAGVVDVKQVPTGIAVYAKGFWPAKMGREALKIVWDDSKAEKRGSAELLQQFRGLSKTPGKVVKAQGDFDGSMAKGGRVVEVEYVFPYLAHAAMEPLNAYLKWDGDSAYARYGCQFPTPDHMAISKVLGLPIEKVKIDVLLAGGSFGRRAQQTTHQAVELAEVAKAIGPGKGVKLVWTREDDMRGGYYRPYSIHRMRGVVRDGKIEAWSDTIVSQSIMKGSFFEAVMFKDGLDPTSYEGSHETPYEVANFKCDMHQVDVGVPVLWWRSVGHTHTGYAVEAFVDELLEAAGKDPVEGRLELMANKKPRHAGVLKAVAELADWKNYKVPEGRARGVAVVESFNTFVAQVVELSMTDDGPKVHKVWCAVDCGVAVNPDIIRSQMEGGIGFGLGHILYAEQTLDAGRPVAGNFDTYRSLRINEMPEIEVTIVKSTEKPSGVGEPGVPPLGPAVANAMAKLGIGRPRQLPVVPGASA